MSWNPSLKTKGEQLLSEIQNIPVETLSTALDREAFDRLDRFQQGVKAYHQHPFVRDMEDPPVIWQDGNIRLLDYGGPSNGPVLLCVPSLINRGYILDLTKRRSLLRTLADKGIRPYLLDWGAPNAKERQYNLEDYISKILDKAVCVLHHQHKTKIQLLGYCMGGVMTTAYASIYPEKIAALVLLATPWDFHAGPAPHQHLIETSRPLLETGIHLNGVLSVDIIQSLFSAIDPYQVIQKFQNFAELKQNSARAEHFVAMEDWLNDGIELAGPVARECLFDWYLENKPIKKQWRLADKIVDPSNIKCPSLIHVAQKDRIVQPESSLVLKDLIPNSQIRTLEAGHIGMVCGQKAVGSLYSPLSKWLLNQRI